MKNGKDAEDEGKRAPFPRNQNEVYGSGECSENEVKGTANTKFLSHISGANASPFFSFDISILDKVIWIRLVLNDIPPTEQKYLVHELLKQFDKANSSDGAPLTSYKLLKIFFKMNHNTFLITFVWRFIT